MLRSAGPSAATHLRAAVASSQALGATVRRGSTDNWHRYRSKESSSRPGGTWASACVTRPYRPRIKGTAERFMRTALDKWTMSSATLAPRLRG